MPVKMLFEKDIVRTSPHNATIKLESVLETYKAIIAARSWPGLESCNVFSQDNASFIPAANRPTLVQQDF